VSDFPRGWFLSNDQNASGAAASVVVPATAGVVHVLDSFVLKLWNGSAAAVTVQVQLSSSDGAFSALGLGRASAGPSNAGDSTAGSGLDLAAGPGASLTVAVNNPAGTGVIQNLVVQGHDI
jgi:hypothetical protein